jgi:hypothetical protein
MAIKESPFQREEYYRQFKKMRIGLGKGFGAIEMDMTGVARVLGDVAILMESTRSEKFIGKIEKFIYQKAYKSLIDAKQYGRGGKRFQNVKKASADHYDKEVEELVLILLLREKVSHILNLQKKIQEKEELLTILYSFMKVEVKEVVLQDRLHQLLQVSNFLQQKNFKN